MEGNAATAGLWCVLTTPLCSPSSRRAPGANASSCFGRRGLDFDTVRGLALLFSVIFVLLMAVVALLALQPRTWK